jgi:hypothetical protein
MRLSVACAFGLLAYQASGAELAGGYARDCSQMPAEKKAHCEEVNKAMAVCAGKKAGDELTKCLKESRSKK